MIEKLKKKIKQDIHLNELFKGSAITFVIKMSGMAFGYLLIYLISKKNGAEGVGFYNLFVKTLMVLGMLSALGMNISVLRYVGQFNNDANKSKMQLLYRYILSYVIPFSCLIGLFVFFFSKKLTSLLNDTGNYGVILKLVGITLPFFALNLINVEFIRGLKQLKISESIRSLIRPVVMVSFLLYWSSGDLRNVEILYLFIVCIILNWVISSFTIWNNLKNIPKKINDSFSRNELLKVSRPMMTTSILSTLLGVFPIFFIEYYRSTKDVGVFSVAFQIATIISLVLIIINTIAGPKFSELYWNNKHLELQKFISQSTKLMFYVSLILSIVIMTFSKELLGVFGNEFKEGYLCLIILVLGQLVNSITGSVGVLMNMASKQKALKDRFLLITIFSLVFYWYFIPKYGIIGSAIIFTISLITLNLSLVIYVKKTLKISTFYNPFNKVL